MSLITAARSVAAVPLWHGPLPFLVCVAITSIQLYDTVPCSTQSCIILIRRRKCLLVAGVCLLRPVFVRDAASVVPKTNISLRGVSFVSSSVCFSNEVPARS
jgi:hypothetical protein